MRFHPQDRIALVVDGPNIWATAKALGFDIDYKALLAAFSEQAALARAVYFTPMAEHDEFNPLRPLVDWMEFNGWTVTTKPYGSTNLDLAVSMLEMAGTVHHFVLASGNGDFLPVVDAVQRRGRRVTVLSSIKSRPGHCSEDLRRAADAFIDLEDLRPAIARAVRPAREAVSA